MKNTKAWIFRGIVVKLRAMHDPHKELRDAWTESLDHWRKGPAGAVMAEWGRFFEKNGVDVCGWLRQRQVPPKPHRDPDLPSD